MKERTERVHCQTCDGTGKRPLTRAESETLSAMTEDWITVEDVKKKTRTHAGKTAIANRLVVLEGHGLVESTPWCAVRPVKKPGQGRRKLWRLFPSACVGCGNEVAAGKTHCGAPECGGGALPEVMP